MRVGSFQEYLSFAGSLADHSGLALRRHFRQPMAVDDKPDRSLVTAIDREIETTFREKIAKTYPDHGIVGEEFGSHNQDAEYVWVLDPIDGTAGFVTGRPLFGTLIGLLRRGRAILGIIDHPITQERWAGVTGYGTTFNTTACRTRVCTSLDKAMLYATSPHMFPQQDKAAFDMLCRTVKQPQYGLDCYAYGLLASGMIDIVAESTMKPCDFLALAPVVEAAGGRISDWTGRPLDLNSDGRVLAVGDARLQDQILDILSDVAKE